MENPSQFVLIAKRILREFIVLGRVISAGFSGVQKQVETVAKEQQAKNENEKTSPVMRAILEVPNAEKAQNERTKTEEKWLNRWKTLIETGTLIAVVAYVCVNHRQLREMKKAADAAKSAAQTAENSLIVSERPWIVVEEMVATSPLTFLPNGRINMNLSFHLKNVGHSIATGIYLRPYLMANKFDNSMFTVPFSRQADWCDKVRKETPNPYMLKTLFPNDDTWERMGLQLTKEEIDSGSASFPSKESWGKLISPLAYGCVNYKFPFSKDVHQTRFIFSISRALPNSKTSAAFEVINPIIVGRDVPETELIIKNYWVGGTFAD